MWEEETICRAEYWWHACVESTESVGDLYSVPFATEVQPVFPTACKGS